MGERCRALVVAAAALCVAGTTLGCGSGTAMSLQGALKISPVSLNFGDVGVGRTVDSSIALVNSGSAPIAISSVSIAGQMFALASADHLPISIAPGGTHTVKVGFAPATESDFSGELTVADSSAKPIAVLPMYGHGNQGGRLVASPAALSFGGVGLGSAASQTLSLSWSGSNPVTINSMTTSGPGFSTAGLGLPLTLYPGQPIAVNVQFAPTSNGDAAGQIAIGWGTRGGSTVVALSGTGLSGPAGSPELSLSTAKLNFGTIAAGSATTQAVTLTSTGTAPLTVTAGTITGAGFTLGGAALPLTLNPGQSATVQVTFAPTTAGTAGGQLILASNSSSGSSTYVFLSGAASTASPVPQLTVSATQLSFGSVTVNSGTTQALTLTSTGTAPVTVSAATISGSGFSLAGGSLPITLNPMQSTTLQVRFDATSTGTLDGQLTIQSDSATGGTTVVALEGVGAAAPNPQLTVSAAALSFGSVTVDSSTTQALTLSSTGTSAVTVSAAQVTGAGFAVVGGSIPATLAPGQSLTLQVQFAPTTPGLINGQLLLSSDSSSGSTTTITLSGTSTAAPNPQLSLSAATLSFGSVTVNSATTQALTLTSTGTAPVTVSSATVTGAGFSIVSGNFPATLDPGQSMTVQVQFDPTSVGNTTGQITIASTSISGSTMAVALNGTGTAISVPQLTVSTTALSFGNATVNTATTQAITLTSTGTLAVTVNSVVVTGTGFSVVGGGFPLTLAPGQSVAVAVQFTPAAAGPDTGLVTISSNSTSGGSAVVSLSGTGLALAHEVDLSWDAPASSPDPVAGYNVYRALGSGTLQLLTPSPLSSTAYVDTALASGSTYNYVVKSVDAVSVESAASNEFTVSVP